MTPVEIKNCGSSNVNVFAVSKDGARTVNPDNPLRPGDTMTRYVWTLDDSYCRLEIEETA